MGTCDIINFIDTFKESVKNNWDLPAISELFGIEISYGELANRIETLRILWSSKGLQKGEKIAICARNCIDWIVVYMAAVVSGYVAVILPPNISIQDICKLIGHSQSKLLYADEEIIKSIDSQSIPSVLSIINIRQSYSDYRTLSNNDNCLRNTSVFNAYESCEISNFDVLYDNVSISDICSIVYTSGSTGKPKGAMLSVGYFGANIQKMISRYPYCRRDAVVCLAPFYHILGLGGDIATSLCFGMHIVVLNDAIPTNAIFAFQKYNPQKVFLAPIQLFNLINFIIGTDISKIANMREVENDCDINIQSNVYKDILHKSFGENLKVLLTGGARIPPPIESFIVSTLKLPLVCAYGLTETGAISLGIIGKHKLGSGGALLRDIKVRIDSIDPLKIPGEIQLKNNIFSGYYNNESATNAAFTPDGWFHSGDLGYIDEEGNLFITGRCKDMLLTSNGENIYPEETEAVMNASPYIIESILTQRGEKLHAVVVPDREKAFADGLDVVALEKKIDEVVREASKKLPGFAIINTFELRDEPLERTPKGSLKRFLYSDGIKEN